MAAFALSSLCLFPPVRSLFPTQSLLRYCSLRLILFVTAHSVSVAPIITFVLCLLPRALPSAARPVKPSLALVPPIPFAFHLSTRILSSSTLSAPNSIIQYPPRQLYSTSLDLCPLCATRYTIQQTQVCPRTLCALRVPFISLPSPSSRVLAFCLFFLTFVLRTLTRMTRYRTDSEGLS